MDQLIPATIILSDVWKMHAKKDTIYFCHGDILMATEGMSGTSTSGLGLHLKLMQFFEKYSSRKYHKGLEVSSRSKIDY